MLLIKGLSKLSFKLIRLLLLKKILGRITFKFFQKFLASFLWISKSFLIKSDFQFLMSIFASFLAIFASAQSSSFFRMFGHV